MKANLTAVLIDHDDSFTFNLQHWLQSFISTVQIINHKTLTKQNFLNADLIVLSPGPKSPQDYPHVISWLKQNDMKKPILGVCLGMQLMAVAADGKVASYSPPVHGKKSKLNSSTSLNGLEVARYHSLKCADLNTFQIVATSDNIPMVIHHNEKKWLGIQFHPESFLTEKTELFQIYVKEWLT